MIKWRKVFFPAVLLVVICTFILWNNYPENVQAYAQGQEQQVVRVAFPVQEGLNEYQEDGSPTGYNYEYLEKMSEYTGWKLEYVSYEAENEDEALAAAIQDMQDGKIDLLGPCMKLGEQKEEQLEYPQLSYGSVYTTLCALSTGSIRNENVFLQSSLHVGLLENTESRNEEVMEYLDAQKVVYEISYYESEETLMIALKDGEIDVIAGISLSPVKGTRIVKKFAPLPYYLVAARGNTALLEQMDEAIARLNQVQPNYQSELFDKYFKSSDSEFSLTDSQKEYLESIGTLRILCVDNDGPYVFVKDGQAAGMLVYVINNFAEVCNITTEYTFCQNRAEAENMLSQSDYDLMIGTPFTSEYCARIGFITSEKIMESNFLLAYRNSDSKRETVAIVRGAESLIDTSGYREVMLYDNTKECLKAVNNGEADVAIGDRSILEYYTNEGHSTLHVTLLTGETQNISIALSQKCDLEFMRLFNEYIYSLTDVEKTNYLDKGSVHTDHMSVALFIQTYPIQTVAIVSVLSVALALICFGIYYVNRMRIKNEELRMANEVKSEFLTRMSHDIRTPMNGIIGLLDISDRFVEEPQTVRKYHKKIHMASEYLLSLINNVLDMSRLESGKVSLVKESVYLREIIDNCKDILEVRAEEEGIKLDASGMDEFNPPRVFTSPLHLRQIFMNIIGNAIKYNRPDGSVIVTAEILNQTEKTVTCEFVIEDTGIGMSEDFQKHAFEAFSQENQDLHGEIKGTGLGLSIVKKLVDIMSGSIRIESRLGEGSRFTIRLTFEIDTDYQEKPEVETFSQIDSLIGKRVLAAEDNELNAEILQFVLEDAGMEVIIVSNGRLAVEAFMESEPGDFDFILMDIMMPEMNGYEAARAVRKLARKDAKSIPIVALTANAYAEDKQKALNAGMNAHIAKPVDLGELMQTLKNLL